MIRAHIFCRVIDNFGDIGVCWRLARQLHTEFGVDVTLIVDDLHSFQRLAPSIQPDLPQQALDGLQVQHWNDSDMALTVADLVIEAFACEIPEHYQLAMAQAATPPVWINLEYLSAEDWVDGCHGLSSQHPRLPLRKTFWFPGFTAQTGGLLREADAISTLGPSATHRQITLFGYEQPALSSLLDALSRDQRPTTLLVFAGRALADVERWLSGPLAIGEQAQRGNLIIECLPLLAHRDYDALLATSDLNLVRGEDSFVRAQWAGQPMLWHIYPQDQQVHLDKLNAWLQRIRLSMGTTPLPASFAPALQCWNDPTHAQQRSADDWFRFLADLDQLRICMHHWRDVLCHQADLATQLMRFYANQVESPPVK